MIIETNQSLEAYCKELSKKRIVFMDTEFDRRSTYFSKSSFITISDGRKTNIIDCLQKKLSLNPLEKIISNKKITKVFHGSQQDLEIFRNMKIKINSIFDTQIAAQFCGYKNAPSYANLASDICKVSIDKTLQNSDWLKRPVNKKMISYLELDVKYLSKIYKFFNRKLKKNKNLQFFNEEMNNINVISNLISSSAIRKKINHQNIKLKQFQDLLKFREKIAKQKNIPKNWVFKDEDINNIIENKNYLNLKKNKNLNINERKKIISLFQKIKLKKIKINFNSNIEKLVNILKSEISKKYIIAEQLIATKNEIKLFLDNDIIIQSKWRNKIFYKPIEKLIKKGINIKINNNKIIF